MHICAWDMVRALVSWTQDIRRVRILGEALGLVLQAFRRQQLVLSAQLLWDTGPRLPVALVGGGSMIVACDRSAWHSLNKTMTQKCFRYECYRVFIYELVGSQVPWTLRLDSHEKFDKEPRDLALLPLHHSSENLAIPSGKSLSFRLG